MRHQNEKTVGPKIESVPQPRCHGDTQTNKQLNRDDLGLTKLLSTGD